MGAISEIELFKNRVGRPVKYTYEYTFPLIQNWFNQAKEQTFDKIIFDQKNGEQKTLKLNKPFTIQHFCLNTGIDYKTFQAVIESDYNDSNCIYEKELIQLFIYVRDLIKDNQISGAILNEYNAQIVSRLNGLNDTINVESNNQPVINISLPGFNANFNKLNENNAIDIDFEVVSPIELTEVNLNE